MRKYSSITPKFWIGKTGRKLRGDISAKLVAAYLLSCPNNDMTGVFYCPLCQISAETGLPLEAPSVPLPSPFQGPLKGIREALETLQREDFAIYDYESEYVFVKKMALFQIAPELKPTDKRVTGIRTAIESMPENFKSLFIKEYNECFNLGFKNIPPPDFEEFCNQTQGENKTFESPLEAPSKALRSQEQEQEQEQEHIRKENIKEKNPPTTSGLENQSEDELPFSEPETPTISKTETVEKKAKRKSKAKQPCPFNDGDVIPEDFLKIAEQYHIANPQLLFQKMISYCKSNGKEYVDYKAAFRTFCIQDQERSRGKQSSGTNSNNSAPMPYEPPGGFTEDYYRKGCKFDDKGNILL